MKGTGGGHCANGCQICADCRASSLEVGDDIVCGEWGGSEIGSWDSSSSEESQSLQVSADFLSVYKREDKSGCKSGGNSNGYAYTDQLEIGQIGAHRRV